MKPAESTVFLEIEAQIKALKPQTISTERKVVLQALIDYIQLKVTANQSIRLHFICTHNSRRSHFSQIWAQTLAHYFHIKNLFSYSGGTEESALFPMLVESLQQTGFQIQTLANKENPIYSIKYAQNEHAILGFSKTWDAHFNPSSEFAAILTCSQADEACPFIPGAEKRIPITYEDPKAFDNSPLQAEKYQETSIKIATELAYVFSQIKL